MDNLYVYTALYYQAKLLEKCTISAVTLKLVIISQKKIFNFGRSHQLQALAENLIQSELVFPSV